MRKEIFVALFILFLIGLVSACNCPLDSNDYDYVLEIDQGLRSDLVGGPINSSEISLSLTSGNYEVTLVSRDSYDSRTGTFQPNEQYMLSFISGSNEILTAPTEDLEDYVSYAEFNGIVESKLNLPNGADHIKAVHYMFDSVPTPTANSLTAVCVGINKLEDPECGNGLVEEREECDEGLFNDFLCWAGYEESCTYCTSTCENKTLYGPRCGDGEIQPCEECDDGNLIDGDGCSSECLIEEVDPFCGDNNIDVGEQCDDGNLIDGDGCSSTCEIEVPESECGNGIVETGEECDLGLGNTDNCNPLYGDSCSYCSTSCEEITLYGPYCGDGVLDSTYEECDDGNNYNDDKCTNKCEIEECEKECNDCDDSYFEYGTPFEGKRKIITGEVIDEGITLNQKKSEGYEFNWVIIPGILLVLLIILFIIWVFKR